MYMILVKRCVCVCVCVGMGSSKVPNQLLHAFSVPFHFHVITEPAPLCLGPRVPLPLRLLHIAYIRRRMTLCCRRVALEKRVWRRGKEDGWRSVQKGPQMSRRAAKVWWVLWFAGWHLHTSREITSCVSPGQVQCCGHCHAVAERQRRREKLICAPSSSCAERDVRFWNANKPCCLDLLLLSGRGWLPLIHLATRSEPHNLVGDWRNLTVV